MTGDYSRFLFGDRGSHIVVIPQVVAAWLWHQCNLRNVREPDDSEVAGVLVALRYAAADLVSPSGSAIPTAEPDSVGQLEQHMNTRAAADQLNITPRAITAAITERRLEAIKHDGRWQINQHDLDKYHRRDR